MSLQIDPIGYCLLRELVEADEAKTAMKDAGDAHSRTAHTEALRAYWARCHDYDVLSEALLSHLAIMPCPQIDLNDYVNALKERMAQTEDERDAGKVWDAGEAIAQQAIKLYRGMK